MVRALLAYAVKEVQSFHHLKSTFVLNLLSIGFGSITYYYLGCLLNSSNQPHLSKGYFPYVLIGISASTLLANTLSGMVSALSHEQDLGTFEIILLSPLPDCIAFFGLGLWQVFYSSMISLGYIVVCAVSDPTGLSFTCIFGTLIIFFLGGIFALGLGGMISGLNLYFKTGISIAWILSSLFILLGDIYFPIHILPLWLQKIAHFLPLTLMVATLRDLWLASHSLSHISSFLWLLSLYSISSLILFVFLLHWILAKMRQKGTLSSG